MPDTEEEILVFSYESLERANAARDALGQAGLPPRDSRVSVREDEAGPVQGNFTVGNGRPLHNGRPGPVLTGPEVPYEDNFAEVRSRGVCLVEVHIPTGRRAEIASILRSTGGLDASARADAAVRAR